MPLLFLILSLGAVDPPWTPTPHRFHVSYGRMAVEENIAVCNIRFFKHDLEDALRGFHRDDAIVLDASPRSDSLYTAYFNRLFHLAIEGATLTGRVTGSGEETVGRDEMWWYTVQFQADAPIKTITVRNTLLFDLFDDQKNIFKIRYFPGEIDRALYFTEGAEEYSVSF